VTYVTGQTRNTSDQHKVRSTPEKTNPLRGFHHNIVRRRSGGAEHEMSDSVGLYLNEIGMVPLLTAEEEILLAQTIEAGVDARSRREAGERGRELDKAIAAAAAAKDRFIRANLRLVVSVARRYPVPQGMELLDLIQEGNLGLEHAVDKFDWRKGFKFSTYATFWIRQAIGRALDQKASLIRLPGDRSASLRAALRAVSGDGDELDDEHAILHRLSTPTSLDRTVGDDDSNELVDLLGDPNQNPEAEVMAGFDDDALHRMLDVLDTRARHAVEQRFGLGDGRRRSYREVGEELGVTAEAARRLVKRAVGTVRDNALATSDAA
jgi:RNA polymerase primary sigma factor